MSSAPKRRPNARPLGQFVPGAMNEVLAKQGFASGEIVLRWQDIAGAELARRSRPLKLTFPRGRKEPEAAREPATLLVQVEGAFALELQMQASTLIERINRYFGWRCVGSLKIRQGPVGTRKTERPAPVLTGDEKARIRSQVDGIEEDRLAEALLRLGEAVTLDARRGKTGRA
ncbi:DUF721 domain-containing protein [Terrihabitans rhizophilus]|uniref:DciA family protein n=1 Tax=Terrihabitans rhizophilus TaxID=3092662 RepID=A0ABU4RR92_9HYPH|nr:DciA family protein [Terrihabitans sp. PJ23]MDX6807332.1 DciA family protein [Terrihabitans sp. PJ23]